MNLVMIEVFPTDWSPKKTSLYFWRGVTDAELNVGARVVFAAISTGSLVIVRVEGSLNNTKHGQVPGQEMSEMGTGVIFKEDAIISGVALAKHRKIH